MSKTRFVKTGGLAGFLASLRQKGLRVLAPMEKSSASKPAVIYAPWEKGMPVNLAKSTVSPKEAVLPECETLFSFKKSGDASSKMEFAENPAAEPTVVFACRPCDARGFAALDKPYLSGLYEDPYYKAKREALTVIALTCNTGCETCFCHWVGGGPSSPMGSDILMTEIADGFVFQPVSPKGQELLEGLSGLEDGAEQFKEAEEVRKKAWASLVPAPNIMDAPAKLAKIFDDIEFWHNWTDRCISCGACTYFCPTCYCFNITDEGEPQSEKGGRRLRSWDNCMSSLYTREASGHNPRTRKAQRMRNRVSHKFWTFPENWGSFLCSGCGRCITNCPVCLDIRAIVLAAINHNSANGQ